MAKLLVIDDDERGCRLIEAIFRAEGMEVIAAGDGATGLARVERDRPDLLLLDLHLPGEDGLAVLERVRAADSGLPVVMLTAHHDVKTAVRAIQLGAADYQTKPVDADGLVIVVRRALELAALRQEVKALRQSAGGTLAQQMGPSEEVRQVTEQVATVASSGFTVLILGETGTGKEVVARALHRQSERRDKPFVAVDCGAIPELLLESELFGHERGAFTGADRRRQGRFELAEGGTFFLDEVGNLPLALQAKLLRVLESRELQRVGSTSSSPIDVRFIAATNHDLQERATSGSFRADLYFRLAQYTITLPALRERPDDIPYLAQRFLEEAAVELRRPVQRLGASALEALRKHAWPGNVRELRNVIRQGVLRASGVELSRDELRTMLGKARTEAKPLTDGLAEGLSLREIASQAAQHAERGAIAEALRRSGGNKSRAARSLDVDYKTLHLKMKALGVRARDFLP